MSSTQYVLITDTVELDLTILATARLATVSAASPYLDRICRPSGTGDPGDPGRWNQMSRHFHSIRIHRFAHKNDVATARQSPGIGIRESRGQHLGGGLRLFPRTAHGLLSCMDKRQFPIMTRLLGEKPSENRLGRMGSICVMATDR